MNYFRCKGSSEPPQKLVIPTLHSFIPYVLSFCLNFFTTFTALAQEPSIEQLANDPQWRTLLHIHGDNSSRIFPGAFFLAQDGHTNPQSELSATITALTTKDSKTQCSFPARYEWLAENLPEIAALPKVSCPDLETWYASIAPKKVTLIFASSFINNPASAFGHTFLRLDQENSEDLIAYSANFAAATFGEDALTYAAKGIFGGYNGFYSVSPYYQRVNQYSDLENRDIWEYELQFEAAEIRLMVLHLWELIDKPATYYYFDENCSYQILELLSVAKPTISLTESFSSWVIPVDTVRALKSVIGDFHFRPSAQTLLKNRIAHATAEQQTAALRLVDPNANFSLDNIDAATLDLTYELLVYRKISGEIEEQLANKRAFEILAARGADPAGDLVPAVTTPGIRPEQGHGTLQFSTLAGYRNDSLFTRLITRPAFHDLLDPQNGYQKGAQINFFEFALDVVEEDGVELGYFSALDITSLTPKDDFFNPLSWNVRTGLKRVIVREREDSLASYLGGNAGSSWNLHNANTIFSVLLDTEVRVNKHYDSDVNPGIGPKLSLLSYMGEDWAFLSEVQYHRFVEQNAFAANLGLRYALGVERSLVARVAHQREFDREDTALTFGVEWFFTP